MKTKPTFSQKLRYAFENTLSKGTSAIIMWLAILSLLIVCIAAGILAITGIKQPEGEDLNFMEAAWQSLMHTMDSGTLGGDSGWTFRIVMLFVTIGGIFILSSLIGTLTSGLESTLDVMRKGRSKVLETNHTLILGWSSKVFSIISEIIIANENQKKPRIVIMADMDKVEMEDAIRSKFPDTKTTKIICRTGSTLDLTDLEVVNPHDARSIIVLANDEPNADTFVIKSVLALTNGKNRKEGKYNIVAEIKNPKNMEAAELVGSDETVFVLSSDLISRITAQTCRQSGLSVVYSELLTFDGDEIYFQNEPKLVGKTYKESLFAYETSSVIGIFTKDEKALINPAMDTKFNAGDRVIAISEDDDTIVLSGKSSFDIQENLFGKLVSKDPSIEKTLILGWNSRGGRIIQELDNYVAMGSEILIVSESNEVNSDIEELQKSLSKLKLKSIHGDINDKATLVNLKPEIFDHIILLSYTDIDIQESDAKTLICLLHLRNLSEKAKKDFSIVSEMLDIRNRELGVVAKADDFIVSDNLVSLMLSQLSENTDLKKVYDILFEAEGSEVYLKPVSRYVKVGEDVSFYTVLESAARLKESAIGYRISSQSTESDLHFGVNINPNKAKKVKFKEEDFIIVLAED